MKILILASLLSSAWCVTATGPQCTQKMAQVTSVVCSWTQCSPSTTCLNGGTCVPNPCGKDTCSCPAGYVGNLCENDLCNPNPCHNGGTCARAKDFYTCKCALGLTGQNCMENIDDCAPAPCQNGGTCHDGVNAYSCDCAPGYTDLNCATVIPKECLPGNHKVLEDSRRNPNSPAITNGYIKDRYTIKTGDWYRFKIECKNAVIPPFQCYGTGRCASPYPIKFAGNPVVPAMWQASVAEVCDRSRSKCCDIRHKITVRRCDGFTVYRLIKPKDGAYCAIPE